VALRGWKNVAGEETSEGAIGFVQIMSERSFAACVSNTLKRSLSSREGSLEDFAFSKLAMQ
jgi:hypothetical protein